MRRASFYSVVWLASFGLVCGCSTRADEFKIGMKVVPKSADFQLHDGDTILKSGWPFCFYQIGEIADERLLLESAQKRGWAQESDVIPVEKAEEFFTTAIGKATQNASFHYLRALARLEDKDSAGSLADLNEAIRLDPRRSEPYCLRGQVFWLQGKKDRARADFDQAVRLDPSDAEARHLRGLTALEDMNPERAIADLDEAVRRDPARARFVAKCGVVRLMMEQMDAAAADFDEAIRLDPEESEFYELRSGVWSVKEEWDKALADLDRAIQLNPDRASHYLKRGYVRQKMKLYTKALADYRQSLKLKGDDASALNALAWLLATCPDPAIRDGRAAVRLATRACQLTNWNQRENLQTLAAAHAEAGEFQAAVKWQQKAIALIAADDPEWKGHQTTLAQFKVHMPLRDQGEE